MTPAKNNNNAQIYSLNNEILYQGFIYNSKDQKVYYYFATYKTMLKLILEAYSYVNKSRIVLMHVNSWRDTHFK